MFESKLTILFLHHNVLINNKTKFNQYYELVKDAITTNYDHGYPLEVINYFKVRVWNMDNFQNKHIKITKNTIKVLGNRNYTTRQYLKLIP